ncbi:MAG: MFS transporter [Candidatus Pacebacteria bacterium]|nr:MFS transporter [Candidatus Paceibacterota bacterium]
MEQGIHPDVRVFKKNPLSLVYIAGFFFSAHVALTTYINSSFLLEKNITENQVGLVFTMSSILALLLISFVPGFIEKIGKETSFFLTSLIVILSLLGMLFLSSLFSVISLFVLYTALINVTFLLFDVSIEEYTPQESMGSVRGLFLMVNNIAWVIAPLITGYIVDITFGFTWVYILGGILSLLAMLTMMALPTQKPFRMRIKERMDSITSFFSFSFLRHEVITLQESFQYIRKEKTLSKILFTHWLLRFFEVWMIIYAPIYLSQHIGFSWQSIGLIFTIMLLPFVLFQFPLGFLADKKHIERKGIITGFYIVGISTIGMIFIQNPIVWLWAGILFFTRIGSSAIEVLTDTLFFKKISATDITSMSIYRNARPVAFIVAPVAGSIILSLGISFKFLFLILGILMLFGGYFAQKIPRII